MKNKQLKDIQKKLSEIQEMLDDLKKENPVQKVTYIPVEIRNYGYNPDTYDPCEFCDNNPKNNPLASGFCNCELPALYGPFRITY